MSDLATQKAAILQAISEAEQLRHGDRSVTNRSIADLKEALRLVEAQEQAIASRRRAVRFSVATFNE